MAYENDTIVSVFQTSTSPRDLEAALAWVLGKADFVECITETADQSGIPYENFKIAIKTNIMMTINKSLMPAASTDPLLVSYLVTTLESLGFRDISIVESENTLSKWYENRKVSCVADYVGYNAYSNLAGRIIDLTNEPGETISYDYGGSLGLDYCGKTWKEADFRISFGKNKTTTFAHGTFTLKNTLGCFPVMDKLKQYHEKEVEFDAAISDSMNALPLHFGIIDGIQSASGLYGLFGGHPVDTYTLLAGKNPIAVDMEAMKLMGFEDPMVNRMIKSAIAIVLGGTPPVYTVEGEASPYERWTNVPLNLPAFLDVMEEGLYATYFILRIASMFIDKEAFPPKRSLENQLKTTDIEFGKIPSAVESIYKKLKVKQKERFHSFVKTVETNLKELI